MATTKTYHAIANSFTVMDIAEPVIRAKASDTVEDVWERLSEVAPNIWFCMIRRGHQIVGYQSLDDQYVSEANVGDIAHPITPDQIVPASTAILATLPLFKQYWFFFVLDKNAITHVVSFLDLEKLPMKMCLFALFMELEAIMLNILSANAVVYLQHLSKSRLAQLRSLARAKYGEEPGSWSPDSLQRELDRRLLQSTSFTDKNNMFQLDPTLLNLLPFRNKVEVQEFFALLQKMRNQVAHSDSILSVIDNPKDLNKFIAKLNQVILKLA